MSNKDKILSISRKLELSHIGSNLSCLPILEEIYVKKKPQDKVILDNAHAHLAHLVIMQRYVEDSSGLIRFDPEELIKKYGIHCDKRAGCDSFGGSLGHGLGISIGLALINRNRTVYCIVSDGSMMEGSNWEALRLINTYKLKNIKIYCNFNGYSAVSEVNLEQLVARMRQFTPIKVFYTNNTERFKGVKGHYIKI
jgi:transketolase N-terminal domain/subunit